MWIEWYTTFQNYPMKEAQKAWTKTQDITGSIL